VLTAGGSYTVPRAYFTTTAGDAGELRRHLIVTQEIQSGSDQHSSGEGDGVDDDTGTLTFQCFDSAAALNHVARAAHYPRPMGEINVAEVLLWVFLFLPLEHPTLMAVAAVSRAWRAAVAYLPHWCLLPALYRVNEDMRRAYELNFNEALVDGAEVITREEYVGLMLTCNLAYSCAVGTMDVCRVGRVNAGSIMAAPRVQAPCAQRLAVRVEHLGNRCAG
jgi:hypothetical protein